MIRIRDITLPAEHDENALLYLASQQLHVSASEISALQIVRRSLDARKKPLLRWVYTVDVTLRSGEGRVLRRNKSSKITKETPFVYQVPKCRSERRPVVVGFGPAGMFAALVLAIAGRQHRSAGKRLRRSGIPVCSIRNPTFSSGRAAQAPFPTES